jgi:hypothetical protein
VHESSDALRFARHPHRKHLRAREAQVRKRFIASEKVDHFHLVSIAWIHSFQRREELIHRKVDNDEIELFPDRRFPVQLVARLLAKAA